MEIPIVEQLHDGVGRKTREYLALIIQIWSSATPIRPSYRLATDEGHTSIEQDLALKCRFLQLNEQIELYDRLPICAVH